MQVAETGHSERNSYFLNVPRCINPLDDPITPMPKELGGSLRKENQPANSGSACQLLELLHDDPAKPGPAAISGRRPPIAVVPLSQTTLMRLRPRCARRPRAR